MPAAHLFVVLRCDNLRAPTSRHVLSNVDEVWLGRGDPGNAQRNIVDGTRRLELSLDDRRMSRQHARLQRTAQGWQLNDLRSSNGSRVDGVPTTTTLLHDGAWIELGQTFLRFRAELPTPATASGDLRSDTLSDAPVALQTLLPELALAFDQLARVARSTVPVMILGETGSGKELLARAVHVLAGRPGPFVALNCGGLPDSLLEAQLFGHVRGAFSGATRDELGYVRAADRGSLFLDEVGDLPGPSQTALLRVLQESEVVPIGATRPIPVDLRVLSATHAPLLELTEQGGFRNDLFARLSGFAFRAPALRERMEDFGLLIAALLPDLEQAGGPICLQPEAARVLLSHAWPRNVRELRQCLAAAAVLAPAHNIEVAHLASTLTQRAPTKPSAAPRVDPVDPDQQLQRELLARFAEHRGNVTQVARAMGKARVQVQRWMKRFGIDPSQFR
jgi:DNA-binding NtrC family response regulator